jgi:hypothetical protein
MSPMEAGDRPTQPAKIEPAVFAVLKPEDNRLFIMKADYHPGPGADTAPPTMQAQVMSGQSPIMDKVYDVSNEYFRIREHLKPGQTLRALTEGERSSFEEALAKVDPKGEKENLAIVRLLYADSLLAARLPQDVTKAKGLLQKMINDYPEMYDKDALTRQLVDTYGIKRKP